MTLKRATAEGVAVAWARTLALPAVSTSLPAVAQWPVLGGTVQGFVTVDAIVGGAVLDTPLRRPVVSFSTWAAVANSDRPQWGAASDLAEELWATTYADPFPGVIVQQDAKHRRAYVQTVKGRGEPRRVPDVDESRAHVVLELELWWTEVPE